MKISPHELIFTPTTNNIHAPRPSVPLASPLSSNIPMMPSKESKAGITTAPTGERHIPASKRPDGTTRREIKIRPGYKPPEDVEVYKNSTAEGWKNRGTGGVPGAAVVGADGGGGASAATAASNKNAKRREARKKAKSTTASSTAAGDDDANGDGEAAPSAAPTQPDAPSKGTPADTEVDALAPIPDDEPEREKAAKKLQKKLRQARELAQKKDSGESLLPEQFEKVIRINDLIRQLDGLGFDAEGVRKA